MASQSTNQSAESQPVAHTVFPWVRDRDGIYSKGNPSDGGDIICKAPEFADVSLSRWTANAELIVRAVPCHQQLVDALEGFINHGYCPNCGCDLWNTAGCPTCPVMRKAYDLLVSLGLRTRREYAAYAEADEINKRNLARAEARP